MKRVPYRERELYHGAKDYEVPYKFSVKGGLFDLAEKNESVY